MASGVLVRVVVMGDGAVGKTTLSIQFTANRFVDYYDPTIEDTYRKQCTIDNVSCMVEILDTAGQEDFSMLMGQWIRSYQAFLLVYSITLRSTFNSIPKIHKLITRTRDTDSVPIVLVGNKCDLDTKREVAAAEGAALAMQIGAEFFETSAKTRHNVENAFFAAVRLHWRMVQPEQREKRRLCSLL